ncbi:MAG TPA: hypothetical protein VGM32_08570 [Rhodopila sp.]
MTTESRFDANPGGSALARLVGRDEELGLLLRRSSQAKDVEGQVVLLSGEPGIGATGIRYWNSAPSSAPGSSMKTGFTIRDQAMIKWCLA